MSRSIPFNVFLEFAPVIYPMPGSGIDFDAGIGARFFSHYLKKHRIWIEYDLGRVPDFYRDFL